LAWKLAPGSISPTAASAAREKLSGVADHETSTPNPEPPPRRPGRAPCSGDAAAGADEVARRAGVAIGTVFRHFPTKEALLEAVVVERLRSLVEEARSQSSADDPGAAFFAFFAQWVELGATKHALAAPSAPAPSATTSASPS